MAPNKATRNKPRNKPKITLGEIMSSGKMTGVYELNSQIRGIVINRRNSICVKYCDVVDTPCSPGQECPAFKYLMGLVSKEKRKKK